MKKTQDDINALLQVISEIFFVILPLIVIFILLLSNNETFDILKRTEWSFISIVLYGQTIIKFISGSLKNSKKRKWQLISLVSTSLLVFGVIPSTTILIILSVNSGQTSFIIYIFQIILFIISVATYIVLGTIGQMNLDEGNGD